uniref:Indole-3-acetaldehyde oxidase-like n=1 Tax=Rhizophora mucronata TaxID=61149 RepID=A0A2P2MQI9_RHIMU
MGQGSKFKYLCRDYFAISFSHSF